MLRSFLKIVSLLLVLKTTICVAQKNNSTGVFLNADDFRSNKITYTKVIGEKYRFQSNNLFNTSFIRITIGDSVYKLKKDYLFGFRTKWNVCYRLFKNEEYEIINPCETILIYRKTVLAGYKTNQVTKYFFSLSADADIYPLTKYNLKLATIGDSLFHDQLDKSFRNDEDLLEFDAFYKIYKLNKIKLK